MKWITENYHTHTERCGHAHGSDRAFVEAAIEAGIRVLGFSDHTPMPFRDPTFRSGAHIPLEKAQGYFDSLTRLREEYKDQITIRIGVEAEYYPETFDTYLDYITQFPVEYLILGQHYIGREEDGDFSMRASDDEIRLAAFFQNLTDAVHSGKFLYIAHPDVINFTGSDAIFRKYAEPFLEEVKQADMALGINRFGILDHRNYPNKVFWRLVGEVGCKALIELDAHTPDVFADEKTEAACLAFAESCGVELVRHLDIPELL